MEENDEYQLTLEELNYEIAQTEDCIKDSEYLLNFEKKYISESQKSRISKAIEINKSILIKLEKQKEKLENESKKKTSRD